MIAPIEKLRKGNRVHKRAHAAAEPSRVCGAEASVSSRVVMSACEFVLPDGK